MYLYVDANSYTNRSSLEQICLRSRALGERCWAPRVRTSETLSRCAPPPIVGRLYLALFDGSSLHARCGTCHVLCVCRDSCTRVTALPSPVHCSSIRARYLINTTLITTRFATPRGGRTRHCQQPTPMAPATIEVASFWDNKYLLTYFGTLLNPQNIAGKI